MLADLVPNVYLDTSSSNRWMRYEDPHLEPALCARYFSGPSTSIGPKRLLFGSDSSFFPRGWHYKIFDDQARALHDLRCTMGDARAIFGENLLRIMAR